jgi:hypothetical protein
MKKSIWDQIKVLNDENLKTFLNENVSKEITEEDISNNIELEVYSAYGGMTVGFVKISDLIEMLKEEDSKELNRDFYLNKI